MHIFITRILYFIKVVITLGILITGVYLSGRQKGVTISTLTVEVLDKISQIT